MISRAVSEAGYAPGSNGFYFAIKFMPSFLISKALHGISPTIIITPWKNDARDCFSFFFFFSFFFSYTRQKNVTLHIIHTYVYKTSTHFLRGSSALTWCIVWISFGHTCRISALKSQTEFSFKFWPIIVCNSNLWIAYIIWTQFENRLQITYAYIIHMCVEAYLHLRNAHLTLKCIECASKHGILTFRIVCTYIIYVMYKLCQIFAFKIMSQKMYVFVLFCNAFYSS